MTEDERRERAIELYALGLPLDLIVRETGLTVGALEWAVRKRRVRRPSSVERRAIQRDLRTARIKANIVASPSVSMFAWERLAA